MTACSVLPPPAAEEVLRRYADVLRVGSLEVNGSAVRWKTDTSTELQLQHFSSALFERLRQLRELSSASDEVLHQAPYWVCKAVSINYALIEVLFLVKRKVGAMCTIETRDECGGLVTYSIEARHGNQMHVRLSWRGKNNIVYRDPVTAAKKVKGTLYALETQFSLPPAQKFAPSYHLRLKFERSMAAKFVRTVTCKDIKSRSGEQPVETILLQDPLHSETVQNFDVTALEPLDLDEFCEGDRQALDSNPVAMPSSPLRRAVSPLPPSSPNTPPQRVEPRSFTARSVRWPGDDTRPVGHLRVRVLRAANLDRQGRGIEPYCRCSIGVRTERTGSVSDRGAIGWPDEALEIPVQDIDLRGEVLIEVLDAARGEAAHQSSHLGHLRIPVSTVLSNGGKALVAQPLAGAVCGSLELELELLTESLPEAPDSDGQGSSSE